MRILFLTPWYPNDSNPDYGIFVRNMAAAVAENHEVMVIFSKVDYSSFGFCSIKRSSAQFGKIREHRYSIKRSLPVYNQLNYFLLTIWYSWREARRFKPDLIHGNISFPGGFWSWTVSRIIRKPFVMTEHTRMIHNFRSPVHRWLSVFSIRRARSILTVSRRMASEIALLTSRPCVVIPNIIVTDIFRDIFPAPSGPIVQIGFLGGLDRKIKGLDIVLTSLSNIQKDFVLHIAGDGHLADEYKRMAADLGIAGKCVFYGTTHHWEVPAWMAKLNFFVSGSRFESFGMAILEAISCGLPVVATQCGGPEDFVTSRCGRLIPPENVEKMQEAIVWMMDHYSDFDTRELKDYVTSRFAPNIIARDLEAVYDKAIALHN